MRLLAFTDIHANLDAIKILSEKAKSFHCELLVCAGDISWFGEGSKEMLAALNKIGLPIMLIHGNHEDDEELAELAKQYKNIRWIHKDTHEYKGYLFMGFGGGGFSSTEPEFVKFAKKHKEKKNIILVTHQPPYNTSTDELWSGEKVGNKDFRKFIEETQPILAICGHIHDSHGKQDMINDSVIINPGPLGRVVELDDKEETDNQNK